MIRQELFDDDWNRIDFASAADGYVELPPWPEEVRVSGTLRNWQKTAFTGEELIGVLWRSEPGTIKLDDYPFDQTVIVLRGDLTLKATGGRERNFATGSTFLLPRGFSGLWIMPSDYEELIIVERQTYFRHE